MAQWTKGQSGNPAGRPPGSRNVQTELREALNAHGQDLLDQLVEKAKAGESTALRFLLKRLLPSAKSAPIQVPLQLEGTAAEQAEQVKHRLAEGLLTFDEARGLLDAIHAVELTKETAELSQKVRELEEKLDLVGHIRESLRSVRESRENTRSRLKAIEEAMPDPDDLTFQEFSDDLFAEIKSQPAPLAALALKQLSEMDIESEVRAVFYEASNDPLHASRAHMIAFLRRTAKAMPEVAKIVGERWEVDWELPPAAPAADASLPQQLNGAGSVAPGASDGVQTHQ